MGLLFLNIEAAQAGLINRFKQYIHLGFTNWQLLLAALIVVFMWSFAYIIFTPVIIGNQKSIWLNYTGDHELDTNFKNKKEFVKKTSALLNGQ